MELWNESMGLSRVSGYGSYMHVRGISQCQKDLTLK